jgi:hypothetical protein
MHNLFLTLGQLLIALVLVGFAQADYIIDDSNSSVVQYGPSMWAHDLGDTEPTKLFGSTV